MIELDIFNRLLEKVPGRATAEAVARSAGEPGAARRSALSG